MDYFLLARVLIFEDTILCIKVIAMSHSDFYLVLKSAKLKILTPFRGLDTFLIKSL